MSVASLLTPITDGIAALSSPPTRLAEDWSDRHLVASGATAYQLRVAQIAEDEEASSEVKRQVARVVLRVVHRLADPADPAAYTEALMLTHQESLFSAAWWRALSSLVVATSAPREEEAVEVVQGVVTYAVRVELHANRT